MDEEFDTGHEEKTVPDTKRKTINIIILIIGNILLISFVILILYFIFKKKNSENKETFFDKLSKYKTPYYLYNTTLLKETISTCLSYANKNNIKIHFSLKSNFNEKILKILSSYKEIGADCVSGGEVGLALKYFKPESIVFAGIGKTEEEIESAVDNNIFCLNVESFEELETLNEICKKKKKKMRFATRINPNILAHTHEKITTGLNENKFGIFLDENEENFYNKIKDIYTNKDNE